MNGIQERAKEILSDWGRHLMLADREDLSFQTRSPAVCCIIDYVTKLEVALKQATENMPASRVPNESNAPHGPAKTIDRAAFREALVTRFDVAHERILKDAPGMQGINRAREATFLDIINLLDEWTG